MTLTANRRATPHDMPGARRADSGRVTTIQGPGNLDLSVEEVNADTARAWLEKNMINRNIRKPKLAKMIRDMVKGRWRPIGDPIRFDVEDALCDGQHRLTALIEADKEKPGISVPLIVLRGIEVEDRAVIDTGSARTPGDQLKIRGYRNHTVLAHAAKWAIWWENDQFGIDNKARGLTHSEVVDFVEDNARFEPSVAHCIARYAKKIDMPAGYVCIGYYILSGVHQEDAEDFFERLAEGYGLGKGEPILTLRNKLNTLQRQRSTGLLGEEWLSLLFRTWNAHRTGKPLRALPIDKPDPYDPNLRVPIPCPDPV
jgi:hypothetical protein